MPEPRRFNINVIALIAATGGFLFGYDLSIASGALIFLKEQFDLAQRPGVPGLPSGASYRGRRDRLTERVAGTKAPGGSRGFRV